MKTEKTGKATFKSKQSPKLSFRFKGTKYRFNKGYLSTGDAELIKYLSKAYFCEEVK